MENFSKNKGRPAIPGKKKYAALYHECSERSLNNKIAAGEAFHYLGYKLPYTGAYAWLFEQTPQGRFKRETLISEIGRLQNSELIKQVAEYICQQKPKVKDGVVMVRGYRQSLQGKKSAAPNCITLTNELLNTINSYLTRYPEATKRFILMALENATDAINDQDNLA